MEVSCNDVKFDISVIEHYDEGNKYEINIKIPMSYGWINYIDYNVCNNWGHQTFRMQHIKNEDGYCFFKTIANLKNSALYHYYFSYDINNEIKYIKKDNQNNNGEMFKMSVNFDVPSWAQGKIMYHIFVDRFNRNEKVKIIPLPRRHIYQSWDEEVKLGPDENNIWNNDFYGGNLQGIIDKLDYIQSLGVSILYLSPIVYSQSNHRYDTADYEQVDPYVGVNEDLAILCREAHNRNMKVILDAVFNHTGNDSKYFNEFNTFENIGAYQNSNSPYASFYKCEYTNGKPEFSYWWGMKNLPVCNGESYDWQQYITGENGIIDKWFNLGIDGLRLDVADELTDHFIELIRKAVLRNKKDGFIIGEVWKNPMRMHRGYLENGNCMDTVMNYNYISSLIKYFRYGDARELIDKTKEIMTEYPDASIFSLMNFTSTHDITRAINLWDASIFNNYGEWAWTLNNEDYRFCKQYQISWEQYNQYKNLYMSYIFALTFLPGNLSIFYGDEVGMQGIGNLNNRKSYPWQKQDIELLNLFKYIGAIRKNESFLEKANLKLQQVNSDILTFERNNLNTDMFVAINRTNHDIPITIPKEYEESEKVYVLKKSNSKSLAPYGGIALKKYS